MGIEEEEEEGESESSGGEEDDEEKEGTGVLGGWKFSSVMNKFEMVQCEVIMSFLVGAFMVLF